MSDPRRTTEIEAKFAVADVAVFERLQAASELAGFALAEAAGKQVRDTYLDTADRAMMRRGYCCRRRKRGGTLQITCKALTSAPGGNGTRGDDGPGAGSGAIHRREELEITLPREVPPADWPAGEVRDLVTGAIGDAALEPLVELRQTRLVRRAMRDGHTVAELSLDRVVVAAADGDRPPYYEVEAELAPAGDEADLVAIAASLRDDYGLTPEPHSKFERALAAIGAPPVAAPARRSRRRAPAAPKATRPARPAATPRPAAKARPAPTAGTDATAAPATAAEPATPAGDAPVPSAAKTPKRPGLRADDTMAEAARKTLRFHFRKMLDHEAGTRLGEDPEELHDMRVATRRMRAAFQVFGAHLDPSVARPFVRGLRRTGRALGDVRDLDVFDEKTQHYLDTLPTERRDELEPLRAVWRRQRGAARERMLAHLDSDRHRRFVERYAEFLETPGAGAVPTLLDDGQALPTRVADVLPAAIYERMAAVWAYDAPLAEPEPPLVRFHRLRIAGKFLRYTLEFFEEALGPGARPLIKSTKRLQDHLGDLQDAVVASNVLRNVLTWGTWDLPSKPSRAPLETIVAPGLAAYLAVRQEELHRLVVTFPETWPQIRGEEFSRSLAALVADLTARQPRRPRTRPQARPRRETAGPADRPSR